MSQPISDDCDHLCSTAVVFFDIESGNIRDKRTVTITINVQYQRRLLLLTKRPKPLAAQIQAKLKWHIKPGQSVVRIDLRPGDVVNAVLTVFDQGQDLVESRLPRITWVKSRLRHQPHMTDCKDQAL